MLDKLALHKIMDATDSGIIILNKDARIQIWNKWLATYTDLSQSSVINKTLHEVFGDAVHKRVHSVIDHALNKNQSTFLSPRLNKHPLPLYRKNDVKELLYQKITISKLTTEDDERYCIININDVSASAKREASLKKQTQALKETTENLKISEKIIRHVALHDSLTTLANRILFSDRLNMAIEQARRQNEFVSIMLIDIDYFKQINDSYGHDTGDKLLIEIGNRIKSCIRSSDTAARLGGDEFAVIQTQLKKLDLDGISKLAGKLNEILSSPIILDGRIIKTGASIGISVFPLDADNSTDLVKNADLAMYNAKENGRSNWQLYSDEMRSLIKLKQQQKDALIDAINNNRITVHYQPEINLNNGQIITLEALVRYIDADGKLVMPDNFINIAEESNLINDLTKSVLKNICNLYSNSKDNCIPDVAINISSKQFSDKDLIHKLKDTHKFIKSHCSKLEVEITESVLMENTNDAISILEELSGLGISIAIDDFGTGYSSLEYLKKFPVHKLKIDRSFINNVCTDNSDEVITNSIISLGHNLGMSVLAEGVETKDQVDFLLNKNCDSAQGYYYSKPVSESDIYALFNKIKAA
ncbi:MAG TPA: EAL domain-containing protein [Thiotrichaceae bacterium]|jgi:diguanylate cyclase (GGDEF)-like protein|nr:EAL domain-containing protein [Thiotrichaceae bacterium]